MKTAEDFAIDAFNIINLHPLPTGSDAREALERLFIHAQQEALESAAVLCKEDMEAEKHLAELAKKAGDGKALVAHSYSADGSKCLMVNIRNLKEGE